MGYASLVLSEPSLVAYWRMNETFGSVFADSKGGRDALIGPGVTLNRTGFLYTGTAAFFNGSVGFSEVPYDDVFHPGFLSTPHPYSVEVWAQDFNPSGIGWVAGVTYLVAGAPGVGIQVYDYGGRLGTAYTLGSPPDGNWHHLVETYDGTTYRYYRDALLSGTTVDPGGPPVSSNPFVIGGIGPDSEHGLSVPAGPGTFFNGNISNVAFYGGALSAARILAHFNSAFVPDPTIYHKVGSASAVFTPSGDAVFRGVRGQAVVTQLPVEVVRGMQDGLAVVTQVVAEVVRPFVAGSSNDFPVDASNSVVFTPTAHSGRGFSAAGTASVTLMPHGKGFHGIYKESFSTVAFSARAVLTNRAGGGLAAVRVIFRARAKNKFLPVVFGDDYLGRFQLGQEVPLWVLVRDQHGVPALPTVEPPTARVYNLDTRRFVESLEMVRLKRSRLDSVYTRGLPLGRLYTPGRHAVLYRAPSGGFTGYNMAIFEVVAGGDPAGPSVASHSFPAPSGDQAIVQLGAGMLAKGSRPRVS